MLYAPLSSVMKKWTSTPTHDMGTLFGQINKLFVTLAVQEIQFQTCLKEFGFNEGQQTSAALLDFQPL